MLAHAHQHPILPCRCHIHFRKTATPSNNYRVTFNLYIFLYRKKDGNSWFNHAENGAMGERTRSTSTARHWGEAGGLSIGTVFLSSPSSYFHVSNLHSNFSSNILSRLRGNGKWTCIKIHGVLFILSIESTCLGQKTNNKTAKHRNKRRRKT